MDRKGNSWLHILVAIALMAIGIVFGVSSLGSSVGEALSEGYEAILLGAVLAAGWLVGRLLYRVGSKSREDLRGWPALDIFKPEIGLVGLVLVLVCLIALMRGFDGIGTMGLGITGLILMGIGVAGSGLLQAAVVLFSKETSEQVDEALHAMEVGATTEADRLLRQLAATAEELPPEEAAVLDALVDNQQGLLGVIDEPLALANVDELGEPANQRLAALQSLVRRRRAALGPGDTRTADALRRLGHAFLGREEYDKADELFTEAIAIFESKPELGGTIRAELGETYVLRSQARGKQGFADKALEDGRRALKTVAGLEESNHRRVYVEANAYNAIAVSHIRAEEPTKAIEACDNAIRRMRNSDTDRDRATLAVAHRNRAHALELNGDLEGAYAENKESVRLLRSLEVPAARSLGISLNNLASVRSKREKELELAEGEIEEALSLLRISGDKTYRLSNAFDTAAQIAIGRRDWARARRYIGDVDRYFDPDNPRLRRLKRLLPLRRAVVLGALEDKETSCDDLRKYAATTSDVEVQETAQTYLEYLGC